MKVHKTYTVGTVKTTWVGYISDNSVNLDLTIPNGEVKFDMSLRDAKKFAERILERIKQHETEEQRERAERANAEN